MGCISRGSIGERMDDHDGSIKAIVISDDGKLIVTSSRARTIRRWDAIEGKAIGDAMQLSE